MRTFNWGIVGAGKIARQFAKGLSVLPAANLYAIASRDQGRAAQFAAEFTVPNAYDSYQALAGDPAVDIVYVALVNHVHYDVVMQMLRAGKAVLCEKPMVMTAAQAKEAAALARSKGLFLMEAMWWRFLPVYRKVEQWVQAGAIGDVRLVKADFGYGKTYQGGERQLYPELGGGALYDVGVYNISLANMFLGDCKAVAGQARMSDTGVDMDSTATLHYKNGGLAVCTASIATTTPWDGWLLGSKGCIQIKEYWHATTATLKVPGQPDETVECPFQGNGYEFEAAHTMECLQNGQTESGIMPLSESIATADIVDELLCQYGFGAQA